jgi:flagellar secretion chaperone FliS
MMPSTRDNYLAMEVRTSPPQKLHLMLIEAALRSARRARQHWQAKQDEDALASLIHAQQVVGELIGGMDREAAPELTERVAAVYGFIFRSLVRAGHRHEEQSLDDAIRILDVERETWRQLCEKLSGVEVRGHQHSAPPPPKLPMLAGGDFDSLPSAGLLLEG